MTEEDRRTRTRHLPDVEGFTALTKSECKSDLKISRSWDPPGYQSGEVRKGEVLERMAGVKRQHRTHLRYN